MIHFNSLFIISTLLFYNIAFGQISEKNYRIYSVKEKAEVPLNAIIDEMMTHDVLFFGEEHNDSVTHFLESKVLELMYNKYKNNLALSMEMFDRDVQIVMNEYLSGAIREKNFTKDARAWSNYRDYKPMVEFAKNNKLNIICANAPSRYTNLVGRKGQQALMDLPKESKINFAPLPYDTATGKYYDKLMGLSSHNPTTTQDTSTKKAPPMMSMGGFNLVWGQSLWDATMAYSISNFLKEHNGMKVLQVNGRFHSDEGFAIVTQLKKYNKKLSSLIISTGSDDSFPNIDWNNHKHLGDYIIITDPNIPKTYKE